MLQEPVKINDKKKGRIRYTRLQRVVVCSCTGHRDGDSQFKFTVKFDNDNVKLTCVECGATALINSALRLQLG